jgi:anti-sigma-K factor RskA
MTGPGQDSVHDLAAAYALGALSAEEVQRFEAFLATSPAAQREVAELRDVAALLALGQSEATPSADLRDRVLARIGESKVAPLSAAQRPSRGRVPPLYWGALAASVLLSLGLTLSLGKTRTELTGLKGALAAAGAALAETRESLASRESTLDKLFAPSVRLYQLTASGDPEPGIQLFWDEKRNTAIIHGYQIKPVPSGKEYQLWFIKDGKPVPSVTFTPESTGHVRVEEIQVPRDGALSAAAVTVEPAGGSPQPTSPILMVGELKKS